MLLEELKGNFDLDELVKHLKDDAFQVQFQNDRKVVVTKPYPDCSGSVHLTVTGSSATADLQVESSETSETSENTLTFDLSNVTPKQVAQELDEELGTMAHDINS